MMFKATCEQCKRKDWKWRVRRREILLPNGQVATIKKKVCGRCNAAIRSLQKQLHAR